MVIEDPSVQLTLVQWLLDGYLGWLLATLFLLAAGVLGTLLVLSVRFGPKVALPTLWDAVVGFAQDWTNTSFRRIYALALLAFKESLRRRVLTALVVFCVVLLFGSLFLDPGTDRPDRMYLEVLFSSATYLLIALAAILGSFSLPQDRADKTVYTVISKPVRPHEMIIGRICGFAGMATVLLAVMGVLSYLFVIRGLSHTHRIDAESASPVLKPGTAPGSPPTLRGQTDFVHGHRHIYEIEPDGTGSTDDGPGHWHRIVTREIDGRKVYEVGEPLGLFKARVPVYGTIRYFDREGKQVEKGINVGKEWTYRSCIEGRTRCAAVWNFKGLTPEAFPNGIRLEMTLSVFRTWKGDMTKGILGSIVLRNPRTKAESSPETFSAREFYIFDHLFPRQVDTPSGKRDLFKDLVDDGELEVVIQCKEHAQYFCMAGPDVYLRSADASFGLNFIKGLYGIWLQVVLATAVGVCAGTFLRGSVTLLVCLTFIVSGFFREFLGQLFRGENFGGGPLESLYRLVNSMNPIIEIEPGPTRDVMEFCDTLLRQLMGGLYNIVPDFTRLNDTAFVSNGFDISPVRLVQHTLTALAFLLPAIVVGHLCLKHRQVD